jgi:hypothetical protein
MCKPDTTSTFASAKYDGSIANQDLMADAGKVKLDDGRPWGRGIWMDFKETTGTHWWSEVKNFNQKTIGVALLMFISIVAPTLAFGSAYAKASDNYIGAIETILATSYVGMTMAMLSGMPLVSISLFISCSVNKHTVSLTSIILLPLKPDHRWFDRSHACHLDCCL